MHRITKLTRAQLETLIFLGVLVLLHVISSVFNIPEGVDPNRSAMANNQTFGTPRVELVKF